MKHKKKNFYIKHFDDYHEIESETHNCMELGCYPTKDGYGYNRYFGLFWRGKRPGIKSILQSILKKVEFGESIHYRTGEDVGFSKDQIISEVREAYRLGCKSHK